VKIGQVAEEAGVSVDTVRFYERRGVLPAAQRRPSGYRVFNHDTVNRIRTAKALQDLGFTLDEIVSALHSHGTCETERWRIEVVVDRLEAKIAELEQARRNAMKTLEDCRAGQCKLKPAAST
jgi:DNA-binding transcriptional MerR regulator